MRRSMLGCALLFAVTAGCGNGSDGGADLATPPSAGGDPGGSGGSAGGADASSTGSTTTSGGTDMAVAGGSDGGGAAPDMAVPDLGPISGALNLTRVGVGAAVNDISIDQGGGLWWVTNAKVYYQPAGATTPFGYDQANGLARGWSSWTTDWWCDPQPCTATYPVKFLSIAGATRGEAVIGNDGAIGDTLQVNPTTGAVTSLVNMAVTSAQVSGSELPEHIRRVVTSWRVTVDLNGTWKGTAYLGGRHGTSAFHGLTADCGCLQFQEHQHYIDDLDVYGTDVRGLAITSAGDLWIGDRKMVSFLPQRSLSPTADLFENFTQHLDVWPGSYDEINGLAVDARDGLWVGSGTHGLAHLDPGTLTMQQYDTSNGLKETGVSAVAVDKNGDVWIGFPSSGLARFRPSANSWAYYNTGDGLPSMEIRSIQVDKLTGQGLVLVGTSYGAAVIKP